MALQIFGGILWAAALLTLMASSTVYGQIIGATIGVSGSVLFVGGCVVGAIEKTKAGPTKP